MVNADKAKPESDHILSREERIREIQSFNLLSDVFRGVERCSGVPAYTPDPDRHRRPESEGGADTVYHFPNQNPFCAARRAGGDREREAVSYRDSAER